MRVLLLILTSFTICCFTYAQRLSTDSLKQLIAQSKEDTTKALLQAELSFGYALRDIDSGFFYSQKAIQLSRTIGYKKGEAAGLRAFGWCSSITGSYTVGIEYALRALKLFEEAGDKDEIGYTYSVLTFNFRELGDYRHALFYGHKAKAIFESLPATHHTPIGSYKKINLGVLAEVYERMGRLDSALVYIEKAYALDMAEYATGRWNTLTFLMGNIHFKLRHYDQALSYYRLALTLAHVNNFSKDIADIHNAIARTQLQKGFTDSAIYYSRRVIEDRHNASYQKGLMEAATTLAQGFRTINSRDSLIKYTELSYALKDSLYNQEKERQIQALAFNEQLRQQQLAEAKEDARKEKIQLLQRAGLIVFFVLVVIFVWVYRLKQQVRLEKMRTRIARDLHDDIGSALGSINILSETVKRHQLAGEAADQDVPLIKKISHTAQQTLESMDDIIWTINPQKDKPEELVQRMRDFAIPLLEAEGITFDFKADTGDLKKLPLEVRKDVFVIFKEAITNVLKHAGCTHVSIDVQAKHQLFYLAIADNGAGFDVSRPSQRNGVKNLQMRAQALRGVLTINSKPGGGTRVQLSLPIR